MTDLRAALGAQRLDAALKRCTHPRAKRFLLETGDTQCSSCQRVIPAARSKMGRNNRLRGNRRELELARTLGGVKVGHAGGPVDVRAGMFNVQSKNWAARFPTYLVAELDKLPRTGGRIPLLIVTGPRTGRERPAIAVVYLSDWRDLHGEEAV